MPRLRILQLISSGGVYGAENVVLQLAHGLTQHNCESIVGVFDNAHRPNLEIAEAAARQGLEVELFECRGQLDRNTIQSIRHYLVRRRIHVLHTHGYKADSYGLRASRGTSVKAVATCHNWPGKSLPLRAYALLDLWQLRYFDHVCAVSEGVRRSLRLALIPDRKISIIKNGVDVERFSNGRPILKDAREFRDKLVVGYVGRLAKEKGLEFLLRAAQKVLSDLPSVVFVLVGEGPERNRLQSLTRDLGIEPNVVFLGQRADLADLYASFDVFVLPSLTEGMPLVVLEAMAARRPVVASRVGSIPQIVRDSETGILLEPGSSRELASALLRLLGNPSNCRLYGENGREAVQRGFSADAMARAYVTIYSKLAFPPLQNHVLRQTETQQN